MNTPRTPLHIIRLLVFSGLSLLARGQQVSIPDAGLNAAVREELGKPDGPLTEQDMLSLTKLDAGGRQISSAEGLETARNLKLLDLSGNALTVFPVAGSLAKLTNLNLSGNHLTSLTLPPEITQLSTFTGTGNPFTSFVLSEPLAASGMAGAVATLEKQGIRVTTYPLEARLTPVRQQPTGAFRFDLSGPPGVYKVFSSPDLTEWSVLETSNNTLGHIVILDTTAHLTSRKFYRAQLQTAPSSMVFVPANTFTMGSPATETGHQADEGPQTTVTFTKGFWMSKFLVTQAEYLAVTGTNPSGFPGDLNRPVESVSWFAASDYCTALTAKDRAAGRIPPGTHYRLPTEAEWECAARAGTTTRFSYGDDPDLTGLAGHAWYANNSGLTPHPVGQKLPNAWGLYDMAGNVWEWCQDWYGTYPGGAVTDPQGPADNPIGWKVIRGGAWEGSEFDCRPASRWFQGASPFITDFIIGFRVVLAFDS